VADIPSHAVDLNFPNEVFSPSDSFAEALLQAGIRPDAPFEREYGLLDFPAYREKYKSSWGDPPPPPESRPPVEGRPPNKPLPEPPPRRRGK